MRNFAKPGKHITAESAVVWFSADDRWFLAGEKYENYKHRFIFYMRLV